MPLKNLKITKFRFLKDMPQAGEVKKKKENSLFMFSCTTQKVFSLGSTQLHF